METAPEAGVRVLAEGKNLVLQGIRRQHAGNYTCTAYNLEGEDTSNVVNLRVMCKLFLYFTTEFVSPRSTLELRPGYFLLQLTEGMTKTCMLLAGSMSIGGSSKGH